MLKYIALAGIIIVALGHVGWANPIPSTTTPFVALAAPAAQTTELPAPKPQNNLAGTASLDALSIKNDGVSQSSETTPSPTPTEGASNSFIVPSWIDLLHTLVKLKALDLQDETLLDDYSIVTECMLYKYYYADEFKWNKVRAAIRGNTLDKLKTFPLTYYFDTELQLGNYDFHNNLYVFSKKATLSHVNSMVVYEVSGPACGNATIHYLPHIFRVVLDAPVTVLGLPLSQNTAEALLMQMNNDHNMDKIVYTRIYFHTVYADPFQRIQRGSDVEFLQSSTSDSGVARIDSRLDGIRFYEDPDRTRLIYEYKP